MVYYFLDKNNIVFRQFKIFVEQRGYIPNKLYNINIIK